MSVDVGILLERYARLLTWGGLLLTLAALATDLRWLEQPIAVLLLTIRLLVPRLFDDRMGAGFGRGGSEGGSATRDALAAAQILKWEHYT